MSRTYRKYIKNIDHVWYDSSNIVYSACFNGADTVERPLKIVFKGGRTYLYKNVSVLDYVRFRDADSQGKVFNELIKKYECIKQDDTGLNSLESMKQEFIKTDTFDEYNVLVKINDTTGEFRLLINNKDVYEGIENKVSVLNLLTAMGIKFEVDTLTEPNQTQEDFENNKII